ncbi:hypothetical protein [Flavobacterium chungangensis]|uniref:Uncharacterized protein n=1 Tax=Flavobacterium chungangensis TaxID=2708132 RepID=A0ABV8ZDF7_9FLAO
MKLIKKSNCFGYDLTTGKIYNVTKGIEVKKIIENKVIVMDNKILKEFEIIYDPHKQKYKVKSKTVILCNGNLY